VEPVFPDQIAVTVERIDEGRPGEVVLRGFEAGPAGEIEVVVDDGLTVMVDYAQPHVLTAIIIAERKLLRFEQVLVDLIGGDRASEVVQIVERGPGRPVRLLAVAERPTSVPQPNRETMRFAEVAQSVATLTDPDQPALIRLLAVAATETRLNGRIGPIWLRLLMQRVNQIASRLAQDSGDELTADLRDLAALDYKLALTSVDLLTEVDVGGRLSGGELRRLVDEVEHRSFRRPRPSDAGGREVDDDYSEIRDIRIDRRGRLSATGVGRPPYKWARVLERADLSVVAVVPVRRIADDAFALDAVVPMRLSAADVIVELVGDPFPVSSSSITRVIAAVRLGQRAASATALGRSNEADELWENCAQAWAAAGDMTRARKAEALSRGTSRSRMGVTRSAFLADRVREALGVDV